MPISDLTEALMQARVAKQAERAGMKALRERIGAQLLMQEYSREQDRRQKLNELQIRYENERQQQEYTRETTLLAKSLDLRYQKMRDDADREVEKSKIEAQKKKEAATEAERAKDNERADSYLKIAMKNLETSQATKKTTEDNKHFNEVVNSPEYKRKEKAFDSTVKQLNEVRKDIIENPVRPVDQKLKDYARYESLRSDSLRNAFALDQAYAEAKGKEFTAEIPELAPDVGMFNTIVGSMTKQERKNFNLKEAMTGQLTDDMLLKVAKELGVGQ